MSPKVLLMIGSFGQGGSERQAVQLARALAQSGRYDVRLACLERSGPLLAEAESLGLGTIAEFRLTSFYDRNAARQARACARFLRETGIDLVQTFDFYTNVFGMAAAALARTPARVAARRETFGFRTGAQRTVERAAYRLAHAVVANAEGVARQITSEGVPARKVCVIHNGLDLSRVRAPDGHTRAELLAAAGLPAAAVGRRLVTVVANMRHPVKDQQTFLRAARRVREAVPGAAFALAGEGELTDSLRALAAELGIAAETYFTGRCADVAALLAVSEVCVLSSRAEGFSNSILEYMAAARAVVATDVGGAREAIVEGETGFLVAAGDDATMAARLVELLSDPARARAMGERARRRVEENFSLAAQLAATERLYERLLGAGASRRTQARALGRAGREEVTGNR